MNQKNLNSFLKLGYFLDYKNENISIDVSNIDNLKYQNISEYDLLNIASSLWNEAVNKSFSLNKKHLVPISGGLDSRAILATLLNYTEAKNIYTYTFGSPNTFDYDIGNFIAKKLGTNHTSYNLEKYIFAENELFDISKRTDSQTILFHHAPVWDIDKNFLGVENWSGFMGDPLAGSKLLKKSSENLEIAKEEFILKNTYTKSLDLTNDTNFKDLISAKIIDKTSLTIDEQLDFQNRQIKYIAPHVLMNGYTYKTPFLYQPWVDFMLSIPNKFREEENFYRKLLLNTFPIAFSYKTKTNYGLSLKATKKEIYLKKIVDKVLRKLNLSKNKNINYIDFDEKIRTNKYLRNIIHKNIMDLKQRNIIDWIDIEKILNNHIQNYGNHSDALIVLSSLEIHLKGGFKL